MEIKKYNSLHKYANRKGYRPDVIVLHNTGGEKLSSAHYWFLNPISQVSAHFLVGMGGEVRQYVDLKDGAWCNGTSTNPSKHTYYKNATSKIVKSRNYNANYYTISIECVGNVGDRLTRSQLTAVAELILHINKEVKEIYGKEIPLDAEHIIRHCDINPNKSTCGCKIFADEIISRVKTLQETAKKTVEKGDLVSISDNAEYWGGKPVPDWVKNQRWYVKTATEGNARIVIDKSEDMKHGICSAIDRKYLKVEEKAK